MRPLLGAQQRRLFDMQWSFDFHNLQRASRRLAGRWWLNLNCQQVALPSNAIAECAQIPDQRGRVRNEQIDYALLDRISRDLLVNAVDLAVLNAILRHHLQGVLKGSRPRMIDLILIPDRRNGAEAANLGIRLRRKLVRHRCDERCGAVARGEESSALRHDTFLERPTLVAYGPTIRLRPALAW